MLDQITPIILAYNEEDNLHRTLSALDWANQVIVIDSYSTDGTLKVCAQYPNVSVIQHPFSSHSEQSNFALSQVTITPWVLSLDADYVMTQQLQAELTALTPNNIDGYQINFRYMVRGKVLKGSLYPPRTCLYRKAKAHYVQDGHTQRVVIDGKVDQLTNVLLHDDRKPYSRWFASQKNYAKLEAKKMVNTPWIKLSWPDRLRFIGLGPLVILPYTLFAKGVIINGIAGLEYTLQRFIAELCLIQARLFNK